MTATTTVPQRRHLSCESRVTGHARESCADVDTVDDSEGGAANDDVSVNFSQLAEVFLSLDIADTDQNFEVSELSSCARHPRFVRNVQKALSISVAGMVGGVETPKVVIFLLPRMLCTTICPLLLSFCASARANFALRPALTEDFAVEHAHAFIAVRVRFWASATLPLSIGGLGL